MTSERDRLRVAIRCDASQTIGGGHVMRCITLANALAGRGAIITFIAAIMPGRLEERIIAAGHGFERIPGSPELHREGSEWEKLPLTSEAQLADAEATSSAVGRSDWVIVDHYLLDACWHSAARSFADHLLVIDDLANRSYDCDILVDQSFGRSADDYRGLVSSSAKVLAGSTYALLRPEFARERPAALARRHCGGPARQILISMGTSDPDGVTARILDGVLAAAPECAIDVVLGPQATSLERVGAIAAGNSGISVHIDSDRMAELMRDADIAIGAAGTTSWERCCLGLPTITLVMADNQRFVASKLESAGAILLAETVEAIPPLIKQLADDMSKRFSIIAAASAVTDGHGSSLVASAIIGKDQQGQGHITLRAARPEDSSMVWLWRNDFSTRAGSRTTEPVPWSDHQTWWKRATDSDDRQFLIAETAGAAVAVLRFDHVRDDQFEVSINLAPSARGLGLGTRILELGCRTFRAQKGPVPLLATIHQENSASRRIFERVGFTRLEPLSNSPFEQYELA